MPVRDIARTGVMTASRDQTAGNLATVMSEEGVGSVVIVEESRPVGIVTDRDLVLSVLEPRKDAREVVAEDLMTETVATVEADAGLFEAMSRLSEKSVRRMPVVDDDGTLAGIVTLDDCLVLLADEFDRLSAVVEAESPPY